MAVGGKARTRRVVKARYAVFLRRAEELLASMEDNLVQGRSIAAGVAGVQAAIAFVDAVTVAQLGELSLGESHSDAAWLLRRSGAPGAESRVEPLRRVLELKYLLEYDDRDPTAAEVQALSERVRRLASWVRGFLSPPSR